MKFRPVVPILLQSVCLRTIRWPRAATTGSSAMLSVAARPTLMMTGQATNGTRMSGVTIAGRVDMQSREKEELLMIVPYSPIPHLLSCFLQHGYGAVGRSASDSRSSQ